MDTNLKNQLAGPKTDIYNPPMGIILRNHDDTLATRGAAKGLKLYDEVERDPHAFAVLQKRKMAVVAYPWEVEPASTRLQDKKAAEFIKEQLNALNFDKVTLDLLDAILKGYAVGEVMWGTDGSNITITEIIPRDQRRFQFDVDFNLRLKTYENLWPGELMPDKKFVVHSVGAKDGNPNGLGLGSRLFWPVFFKRQDITFWLAFADRFGQPLPVGKYAIGTQTEDQNKLLNSLLNIAQEYAVVMPDNSMIEFLETNKTSAGDFYERLAKYMDDQISVCVLGENSTTTGKSSGLNSNQANVHNEVRLELSKADADLLSGTLNKTIVKWLIDFNFAGATPPKIWRNVAQEEDLNTRAERDQKIYQMGFKPSLDYIRETYGDGWEARDMNASLVKPTDNINSSANNPEFAENEAFPDQQALDDAINLMPDSALATQAKTVLKPIISMINEGKNSTDVLGSLAELYPQMDTKALEDLLARLIFITELWGRINAETNT